MTPPFRSMFYVYVLQSIKDKKLYFGLTKDLIRRLKQHNEGKSLATKSRGKFNLIYYEAYRSFADAEERERMLKRFGSTYSHLKRRIKNSIYF
jgi:putative endonuclease